MAFHNPAIQTPFGRTNNPNAQQRRKSDAFINLYLPRKNGTRAKVGSIGLSVDNETGAQMIEAYRADPEGFMQKFAEKVEIEFNLIMAEEGEDTSLDL